MTLIVGFVSGPGGGKSTLASGLFSMLKQDAKNVEYIPEFAKTLTWAKDFETLKFQEYVTCTQQYNQNVMVGQVDAVITDSPIITGLMYYKETNQKIRWAFENYILESYRAQKNMLFLLRRVKGYLKVGRTQTLEEAIEIDNKIRKFLDDKHIDYIEIDGNEEGAIQAFEIVKENLTISH
jgi:nicotinamide riboside kinase